MDNTMDKSYNYLLFDWDGCLANTLTIWLSAYKELLAEYNISLRDKEIVYKLFKSYDEGVAKLDIDNPREFYEKLNLKVKSRLPDASLNRNVLTTLEELKKRGRKMAIVTSAYREIIQPVLDNFSINEYFDAIITHDQLTAGKPNPEGVNKALEIMGGSKEQALIIGDSSADIQTGKNAGIDTVLYYPPVNMIFYDEEKLMELGADYFISDFVELVEII